MKPPWFVISSSRMLTTTTPFFRLHPACHTTSTTSTVFSNVTTSRLIKMCTCSLDLLVSATSPRSHAHFPLSISDSIRSRAKTTGISETTFKIGELNYSMFDGTCSFSGHLRLCSKAHADRPCLFLFLPFPSLLLSLNPLPLLRHLSSLYFASRFPFDSRRSAF
jgi:hypothetical protein